MPILTGFIAGAYTVVYDSTTLGIVEDGIELQLPPNRIDRIQGDNLADCMQDGVYRGGDCFLQMTLLEYRLDAVVKAFYPHRTNTGAFASFGEIPQVGTLISAAAMVLVLTAVVGTPAASQGNAGNPATIIANKCILAPDYDIRLLLAPKLRRIPIRFQLLPFLDGNNRNRWFIATT